MCEAHYVKAIEYNHVTVAESGFGPHVPPPLPTARAVRLEIFTPSQKDAVAE
jgi:hypothetical protein